MIITSHPQSEINSKLIKFLKQKIGLTDSAINLGLRQSKIEQAPLPIILWSFGLLSLKQYQEVLKWESHHS